MKIRNARGELRFTPSKVWRRTRRAVVATVLFVFYSVASRFARKPLVNDDIPVVVSMTSYSSRLRRAHLAVESIARGRARPSRLILWVDAEDLTTALALPTLQRLVKRGLEIRQGNRNYRAHNKYIHFAMSRDAGYLATADDDIFYPHHWLEDLWQEFRGGSCNQVVANWARIPLVKDGVVAPTLDWTDASDQIGRVGAFSLGVAGAIFPDKLRLALAENGSLFLDRAPLADDVWISWSAFNAGVAVRQCKSRSLSPIVVPFTQSQQLATQNTVNGQNDVQIHVTYSPEDQQRLDVTIRNSRMDIRP